jgi:hypothetical protein
MFFSPVNTVQCNLHVSVNNLKFSSVGDLKISYLRETLNGNVIVVRH